MKKYFLHIDITKEYRNEEEEFFFSGNDLGEIFHEITSTVRYYASRDNYEDAWQADGFLFDDGTGKYICSITACVYNHGISIYRDEWEVDYDR